MSDFVLMAGGTGGHLFPAMALAQELGRRGHKVHLITDNRTSRYGENFPAQSVHRVPAATPSVKNPIKFVKAGWVISKGILKSLKILRKLQPDVVVAFGGYPCFAPFVAASLLKISGVLHEQNAVLGRSNRALARMAKVLALSFETTKYADAFAKISTVTGNPVRDAVIDVQNVSYPEMNETIKILVSGGSQGSRIFSDVMPAAIALLPEEVRRKLRIVQQCRPEDLDAVTEQYREARVNVELASFFDDMPNRIADAHLVIGRSGASTVAEIAVIGRPAIFVPLPGSLDQDQKENALVMHRAGGGWVAEQATLSPQSLATQILNLVLAPETLKTAAAAAKTIGRPDAVERLADLVEQAVKRAI